MKQILLQLAISSLFLLPAIGQIPFTELDIDLNTITLSEITTARLSQSQQESLIILDKTKNKLFKATLSDGSFVLFPHSSYDDPQGLNHVHGDFYFSSTSTPGLRYFQQPSPYYENGYTDTFFEETGIITSSSFLYHNYNNWEPGAGIFYSPAASKIYYFSTLHSSFNIPAASIEDSIVTSLIPLRIEGIQSGINKDFYFFMVDDTDGSIHYLNDMKINTVGNKVGFHDLCTFFDEKNQKIYLFASNATEKSLILYSYDESSFTETIIDTDMIEPGELEIGDLNNDSIPELILQDGTKLFLYEFTEFRSGLYTKTLLGDAGEKLDRIVLGDFNSDQKTDVIAAKSGTNAITLFQNDFVSAASSSDFSQGNCYPNPADTYLILDENEQITDLKFYDLHGNEFGIDFTKDFINTSELPNGTYYGVYNTLNKKKRILFQVLH